MTNFSTVNKTGAALIAVSIVPKAVDGHFWTGFPTEGKGSSTQAGEWFSDEQIEDLAFISRAAMQCNGGYNANAGEDIAYGGAGYGQGPCIADAEEWYPMDPFPDSLHQSSCFGGWYSSGQGGGWPSEFVSTRSDQCNVNGSESAGELDNNYSCDCHECPGWNETTKVLEPGSLLAQWIDRWENEATCGKDDEGNPIGCSVDYIRENAFVGTNNDISNMIEIANKWGLMGCPGYMHWSNGFGSSAEYATSLERNPNQSVCAGSRGFANDHQVADDDIRDMVNPGAITGRFKPGDRAKAPFVMHANHRGSMFWVMAPAGCETHECFMGPNYGSSKDAYEKIPAILEFDDLNSWPTVDNKYRMLPRDDHLQTQVGSLAHIEQLSDPAEQQALIELLGGKYNANGVDQYIKFPEQVEFIPEAWIPYMTEANGFDAGAVATDGPVATPRGNYVLMLRWDGQIEQHIFNACHDINIDPANTNCSFPASACNDDGTPSACASGYKLENGACAACSAGFSGVDCSVCAPGYFDSSDTESQLTCEACPSGYTGDGSACDQCAGGYELSGSDCVLIQNDNESDDTPTVDPVDPVVAPDDGVVVDGDYTVLDSSEDYCEANNAKAIDGWCHYAICLTLKDNSKILTCAANGATQSNCWWSLNQKNTVLPVPESAYNKSDGFWNYAYETQCGDRRTISSNGVNFGGDSDSDGDDSTPVVEPETPDEPVVDPETPDVDPVDPVVDPVDPVDDDNTDDDLKYDFSDDFKSYHGNTDFCTARNYDTGSGEIDSLRCSGGFNKDFEPTLCDVKDCAQDGTFYFDSEGVLNTQINVTLTSHEGVRGEDASIEGVSKTASPSDAGPARAFMYLTGAGDTKTSNLLEAGKVFSFDFSVPQEAENILYTKIFHYIDGVNLIGVKGNSELILHPTGDVTPQNTPITITPDKFYTAKLLFASDGSVDIKILDDSGAEVARESKIYSELGTSEFLQASGLQDSPKLGPFMWVSN